MHLLDITLDTLLSNTNINHVLIGKTWYFKHSDINKVYDNNFKYLKVKIVKSKVEGKLNLEKYISFPTIEDHAEFLKNRPSFEKNIDKALGLK